MPSEPAHAWSSVPFTTTPLPLSYHRYNSPLPDIPALHQNGSGLPTRTLRAHPAARPPRVDPDCTDLPARINCLSDELGQKGSLNHIMQVRRTAPCLMRFYLTFPCPYDAPTCYIFSFRICLDAQHAWGTRESTSTPFATRAGLVAAALCAECFMEALLDDSL